MSPQARYAAVLFNDPQAAQEYVNALRANPEIKLDYEQQDLRGLQGVVR